LTGLVAVLVLLGGSPQRAEVTVLRGLGAPFSVSGDEVVNQLRLKVRNRSEARKSFDVELLDMPEAKVVAPELPLVVPASEQAAASFFVVAPRSALHGSRPIQLRVGSGKDSQLVRYTLLGPETGDFHE
jgi:hypothetical protein